VSGFQPFVYQAMTPRAGAAVSGPSGEAAPPPQQKIHSVLVPIPVDIDLSTISGITEPTGETLYTRDYFLTHATEADIQRVYVSADLATSQRTFTLMLVAKDGQEVTELTGERAYTTLPVSEIDVVEDNFPSFKGALFLRVKGRSQVAHLFVTVEALTSQVI
jgi:hypothetical protein